MFVFQDNERYTLEDFKAGSPDDLSPVAFLRWTNRPFTDRHKLYSAYVSLYTEAKKSLLPEVQKDGMEMCQLWMDRGTTMESYWESKCLEKFRVRYIVLSAVCWVCYQDSSY